MSRIAATIIMPEVSPEGDLVQAFENKAEQGKHHDGEDAEQWCELAGERVDRVAARAGHPESQASPPKLEPTA